MELPRATGSRCIWGGKEGKEDWIAFFPEDCKHPSFNRKHTIREKQIHGQRQTHGRCRETLGGDLGNRTNYLIAHCISPLKGLIA